MAITIGQFKTELFRRATDSGVTLSDTAGTIQLLNDAFEQVSLNLDCLHVSQQVTLDPQTTGAPYFMSDGTGLASATAMFAGGSALRKISWLSWDTDSSGGGTWSDPLEERTSLLEILKDYGGTYTADSDYVSEFYQMDVVQDPTVVVSPAAVTTKVPLLKVYYYPKPTGTLTSRLWVDGFRTHTPVTSATQDAGYLEFPAAACELALKYALWVLQKTDHRDDIAARTYQEYQQGLQDGNIALRHTGRRYGTAQRPGGRTPMAPWPTGRG